MLARVSYFLVFLGLALLFLPYRTAIREFEADTPYLYYYSKNDGAFMIENGDASDTVILAEFDLPSSYTSEVTNIVTGPGWSPSGRWFAWRASTQYGGANPAFVVNRETREQIQLLDGVPIAVMKWSPTEDMLMVLATDQNHIVNIIDVAQPESVVEVSSADGYVYLGWSPDGNHIVQYRANEDGSLDLETTLIDSESSSSERSVKHLHGICGIPTWSQHGGFVYFDNELMVGSISNGSVHSFAIDKNSGWIDGVGWSPSGEYALIYLVESCNENTEADLYLLSLTQQDISFVASAITTQPASPNGRLSKWSPDSTQVVFLSNDNQLKVLELANGEIKDISPSEEGYISDIQWINEAQLGFIWRTEGANIYIYDLLSDTLQPMLPPDQEPISLSNFGYSSSHRYLAFASGTLHVIRIGDNQIFQIEPNEI